jgi:DNA-binding NarL/FixJ family response regulator
MRLFQKRPGIAIIGQAADVQTLSDSATAASCDVLLLDSLMPMYATDLFKEIRGPESFMRVVLFGMDDDEAAFLKAVRLGVSGYLLKDASSAEIIAAVRGAADGKAICPPKLCMALFRVTSQDFRDKSGMGEMPADKIGLTYRQRELIGLVAQGLTNKEIAAKLNLSEFTVKNHVHRIMRHVEAGSRQEAVDVVRAKGFLPQA